MSESTTDLVNRVCAAHPEVQALGARLLKVNRNVAQVALALEGLKEEEEALKADFLQIAKMVDGADLMLNNFAKAQRQ